MNINYALIGSLRLKCRGFASMLGFGSMSGLCEKGPTQRVHNSFLILKHNVIKQCVFVHVGPKNKTMDAATSAIQTFDTRGATP